MLHRDPENHRGNTGLPVGDRQNPVPRVACARWLNRVQVLGERVTACLQVNVGSVSLTIQLCTATAAPAALRPELIFPCFPLRSLGCCTPPQTYRCFLTVLPLVNFGSAAF